MTTKSSLTIKDKIRISYVVMSIFIVLASSLTLFFINKNSQVLQTSIKNDFYNSHFLAQLANHANKLKYLENEYLIHMGDSSWRTKLFRQWVTVHNRIQYLINNAMDSTEHMTDFINKEALSRWQSLFHEYAQEFMSIAKKIDHNEIGTASLANQELWRANNIFNVFRDETDSMSTDAYRSANQKTLQIKESYDNFFTVIIVISVIGLLFLSLFLFTIPASIYNAILHVTKSATILSKGDFKSSIEEPGLNDLQPLAEALEKLRVTQKTLVESIQNR